MAAFGGRPVGRTRHQRLWLWLWLRLRLWLWLRLRLRLPMDRALFLPFLILIQAPSRGMIRNEDRSVKPAACTRLRHFEYSTKTPSAFPFGIAPQQ